MFYKGIGCLALVVSLLFAAPANGQLKGFGIGPYVEAGWPTGSFESTHKMGVGAGIFADIKLPGKLGITGSAGYMQFGGKSTEGTSYPSVKAIPIRAGLKYRPLPVLYFKLEGGVANYMDDMSGSAFIASPGVGVRVLGLDFQAKYEAWLGNGDTHGFWGLRAGINF